MVSQELAQAWTDLWNGALDKAESLLADDFRIRFGGARDVDVEGDTVRGPKEMAAMVERFRAQRPGLRFTVDAPPVTDGTGFAVRWGASRPGVAVGGLDLLRVQDGRIAEVWSLTGGRRFPE